MNNVLFQQAQASYSRGDYPSALEAYTQCLQSEGSVLAPGEIGQLYHKIGNCLVKLRDYDEAIHAYAQAAADADYHESGAIHTNLGNCYAALHDYNDAIDNFQIALSDSSYESPYKAYSGLGKAYLKLGKTAEAGSAFRSAALDEANPNPVKSLLNLGICFMALGRPADAVASYESALQFRMSPDTKNKLYANLGQAYTASGRMQQAVDAFEQALADKTYYLNDAASVDYQRAIGAVAQGTAVIEPVEGATGFNDFSGLDVTGDGVPVYSETDQDAAANSPYYYSDSYNVQDQYASPDDRFFHATDEELERWSKGVAKQDRKRRNVGLKALIVIVVLLILVAAAGVFAYSRGYGYPSQETVAQELFANPSGAADAGLFSDELSSDSITAMLDPVVTDANVTVNGVDKSMHSSVVYVTASTEEGGEVQYKITMVRDRIGWAVSNIELYFASQN